MPKPIKGTISGSTAATILGLNQYETPFTIWQKIMEDIEPGFNSLNGYVMPEPFEGNAATRWGHAFENANIEITMDLTGSEIYAREKVFEETHNGVNLSCHVDGLMNDGETLYEGKTTSQQAYRSKWTEEKIPQNNYIQVQHNMFLTGAEDAIVSVLIFPEAPDKFEEMGWRVRDNGNGCYWLQKIMKDESGNFLYDSNYVEGHRKTSEWALTLDDMGFHKIYTIPRNNEIIGKMLEKYSEFWEKYIIPRIPPEPMDVSDIQRMYPEPVGTIVVTDERLIDAVTEYKEIGKEIGKGGNLEKRRAQLKTMFLAGAAKLGAVPDEESSDKWIFRDGQGKKLCSYYWDKRGFWGFR